jgi:uncharacterized protein YceK
MGTYVKKIKVNIMLIKLILRSFALIATITILSGCVTIKTVSEDKPCNKIYSGFIGNVTDGWWLAHSLFLDVPFSFVADTLILPYTIPKTVINYSNKDARCKQPDTPIVPTT